jgi:uncharacterized membrane protein
VELTRAGGTFASLQNPAMQLFQARPLERDADGTLRYEGTAIDAKLVLTLKPERCRDAMSGNVFSYSALATLDGREYRGCGYVGDAFLAKR